MIIGFILLYLVCLLLLNKKERPLTVLAYSTIIYIFFIFLFNELFSIQNLISIRSIYCFWLIFDLFLLLSLILICKKKNLSYFKSIIKNKYEKNKIFIIIGIILTIFLIVISLSTIPYNWDGLSYHLTRIVVWLENGSVAHFSTIDTRMLGTPPLKEFVDLHVYSIIGRFNDSFLNLTQTFSFILNSLFVLEIADRIGCKLKGKIVSILIFASTGTVLAEAFSIQNDQFAATFVLIFIVLMLKLIKEEKFYKINKNLFINMVFIGITIGFSYLSKLSGLFAIIIFSLYLMINALSKKIKPLTFIGVLLIIVVSAVLIISPELIRNIYTYGSIMDPWQGPGQLVQTLDPRYLLVNMLKNIGTNISYSLFPAFLSLYSRGVNFIGRVIHIDITDKLISEIPGEPYILKPSASFSFDTAINILFFVLLLVFIVFALCRLFRTKNHKIDYRLVAFLSLVFALCFIKWEIFMSRYLLVYFAIMSPAIALEIEQFYFKKKKYNDFGIIVTSILCIMMIGAILNYHINNIYNSSQYEIREQSYYRDNSSEYYSIYKKINSYIGNNYYDKIGLYIYSFGEYNYPVIKLLSEHSDNVQIINDKNKTMKYNDNNFDPDLIVMVCYVNNTCPNDMKEYNYNGKVYNTINKESDLVYILEP